MEENLDLLDNGVVTSAYTGKRPVFLTVLCILTFVGVGISVIINWISLYSLNQVEKVVDSMGDMTNDMASTNMGDIYNWWKISIIMNLFGAFMCLVAAIIMLNLRKFGYFIYIGGQIIPILIAFIAAGSDRSGMFGGFGFVWLIALMIFPVGFIVMYGLNFKYMR